MVQPGLAPLVCDLPVDGPEATSRAAVHIEPPVAGEVLLLEESPVGTEEADLVEVPLALVDTHVEGLAVGLGVGVVATVHLTSAAEEGGGYTGQQGIVSARDSRDSRELVLRGDEEQEGGPGCNG